jgi:hypothetical protein
MDNVLLYTPTPLIMSSSSGVGAAPAADTAAAEVEVTLPMTSSSCNGRTPEKSRCNAAGGQPGNFFSIKLFNSATVEFRGTVKRFFLSKKADPTDVDTMIVHVPSMDADAGGAGGGPAELLLASSTSAPPRNEVTVATMRSCLPTRCSRAPACR